MTTVTTAPPSLTLLEPWVSTLKLLGVKPVSACNAMSSTTPRMDVWLKCSLATGASLTFTTRAVEAMELLVLSLWANHDAWAAAQKTVFRSSRHNAGMRGMPELEFHAAPHTCVLGYDIEFATSSDVRAFCQHLLSLKTATNALSHEYYAARETLTTAVLPRCRGSEQIHERLRLQPTFLMSNDRPMMVLPAIATLVRQQQRSGTGLLTRVHALHDVHRWMPSLNERCLSLLASLWSHGIHSASLSHLRFMASEPTDLKDVQRALELLLGVGQKGCVRHIDLGRALQPTLWPWLLSVVCRSSSACEVSVDFEGLDKPGVPVPERRSALQLMTYALFCDHTNTTISKLSLRCRSLTQHHVYLMRRVVQAEDPIVELFPNLASRILEHQDVRVSASCLRLEDPTRPTLNPASTTPPHVHYSDLRVLDHTTTWWSVFAPGWGQAWAAPSRVMLTHVSTQTTRTPRTIAALELTELASARMASAISLLRLVGHGVETLRLDIRASGLDSFYGTIFSACPRLEKLVIKVKTSSRLSDLMDCVSTGRCPRLKWLEIADKEHPMAIRLERFEVHAHRQGHRQQTVALIEAVQRMLETNTVLSHLALQLPAVENRLDGELQRLLARIAEYHNTVLPATDKVAFLCAVRIKARERRGAMQRFDDHILSKILVFVPIRRRFVQVAMPQVQI